MSVVRHISRIGKKIPQNSDFLQGRRKPSKINGYGISRAFTNCVVSTAVPQAYGHSSKISCGESQMRFLYLADGKIGPNMRNFIQLFFQWTGDTTQSDAECLASMLGLNELSPAELDISGDALVALDTHYPRFNAFFHLRTTRLHSPHPRGRSRDESPGTVRHDSKPPSLLARHNRTSRE